MSRSPARNPLVKRIASFTALVALSCCSQILAETIQGMIGVGTWATQAEFKDIQVTHDGQTLFVSDFSHGMDGWKTLRGHWETNDGVLRQTSEVEDARAMIGDPSWSDYKLTLKARKLAGREGFLILFGMPKIDANMSWWNIGGWGNSAHAIQAPGLWSDRVPGQIETNRWYDIELDVEGGTVRTYLDHTLVQTASLPSDQDAQRDLGHALIPDLIADPSISEFNGTFYLYATTDGMGHGLSTSGLPVVWESKDFLNWHFNGSIFPKNFDAKYWAPSSAIQKDGRYYLFPTLDNRITATVADSPEGPFHMIDGRDIHPGTGWQQFPISVGHPIDADIFRDDDGSYYMVWSQRFIARLNADFTGFEGEPVPINTKRGGYSEGPALLKRNGIYYYLYTLGGSENYQYAYMMSHTSPLGPWEAPKEDIIATTDLSKGVFGPGHGCFFNPKGTNRWFFVYLEYGRSGTNRQVFANEMYFNADGTIRPVQVSLDGVGAIRPDTRYAAPNLALGKTATASSTLDNVRIPPIADHRLNRIEEFSPANALDGSNGSRWMAADNETPAWYQLDLGEVRDISRTELYFVKPTTGHAYRLEYSSDGKSWNTYAEHTEISIQSPHTDETPAKARYIKLTILQGTPGLWEFRVY